MNASVWRARPRGGPIGEPTTDTTGQRSGWWVPGGWCILPALEAPQPHPAARAARDDRLLGPNQRPNRQLTDCGARGLDSLADPNADPDAAGAEPGQHLRRRQA